MYLGMSPLIRRRWKCAWCKGNSRYGKSGSHIDHCSESASQKPAYLPEQKAPRTAGFIPSETFEGGVGLGMPPSELGMCHVR